MLQESIIKAIKCHKMSLDLFFVYQDKGTNIEMLHAEFRTLS